MKKIIKRTIAGTFLTLIVFVSGLVTLVFFPQNLFANTITHKNFRVFYDDGTDKTGIETILDDAYALVKKSELHDPDFRFDLFLAHDNIFNSIEGLQGKGPIARATAGNITFKVKLDISNNRVLGIRSEVNLTELLAHEMVHVLQANRYGLVNFSPLKHPPLWKLEGYPEYISRQEMLASVDYDLASEIESFIQLSNASTNGIVEVVKDHFVPSYYYKGRLMVEYLIDVKGWTYDEMLKEERSEDEVFREMVNWAKSKKK